MNVPPGYVVEQVRGNRVIALVSELDSVHRALRSASSLYEWAAGHPSARSHLGRGAAYQVSTDGSDWLVRRYRRGGLVARLLSDRYAAVGAPRPLRELRASEAARGRGVPTPQVLAAAIYDAGPFYRADLVTSFVPDSRELAEVSFGAARIDGDRLAQAWHAAGTLLRLTFAAGIDHADLNLRNILLTRLDDAAPQAWLLDLDRATAGNGPVGRRGRLRMLNRLHRSRRKLEAQSGLALAPAALESFAAGLAGERTGTPA